MKITLNLENAKHVKLLILQAKRPHELSHSYWQVLRTRARRFQTIPKKVIDVIIKQMDGRKQNIVVLDDIEPKNTELEHEFNKIRHHVILLE